MKVGIAGAGIMGQLLALSCLQAGWEVSLFEYGKSCSLAAGGLLTPIAELEKCEEVIYQLGYEALTEHWPRILNQLEDFIYFQQTGSIILSHPRDQAELTRFIQLISSKRNDLALTYLTQAEIETLEPAISRFQHGYFLPQEGHIDSQHLLIMLEKKLLAKGIQWHKDSWVKHVEPHTLHLEDQVVSFDWVLDCRGLGGHSNFKTIRGVRGEAIWLHAPAVTITRPIRFLHPRYSVYIVPRPNHIYFIGASEIESADSSAISVRTTLELLTAAHCVNSDFAEARIINTVTQLRPTLTHHLPRIQYAKGMIAVNGLYRHGFLIAPTLSSEIILGIQENINAVRYPHLWEKAA